MEAEIAEYLPPWLAQLIPQARTGLRLLIILLLAWAGSKIVRRAILLLHLHIAERTTSAEERRRIDTLSRALKYITSVVIWTVTITIELAVLGIPITPILTTAGVVGVAVGFAAQSLVKDYFTGFALLLENQIRQGDMVTVAGVSGIVESISLRHVRLRDDNGNVHFIPNSSITIVTNMSREFAQAIVEVKIARKENVDTVLQLMHGVAAALREDPKFTGKILEDLDVAGVDQWAGGAVGIRCRLKVKPLEQWTVRREYLKRLKLAFDEQGIESPG